jgi:hypothetical protein
MQQEVEESALLERAVLKVYLIAPKCHFFIVTQVDAAQLWCSSPVLEF